MGPKLNVKERAATSKVVENSGNTTKEPKGTANIIDFVTGKRVKLREPKGGKDFEKVRILDMNNPEHAFLDMMGAEVVYEKGKPTVVYVDDERHPMNGKNMKRG